MRDVSQVFLVTVVLDRSMSSFFCSSVVPEKKSVMYVDEFFRIGYGHGT